MMVKDCLPRFRPLAENPRRRQPEKRVAEDELCKPVDKAIYSWRNVARSHEQRDYDEAWGLHGGDKGAVAVLESPVSSALQAEFSGYVERWKDETFHLSSPVRRVAHPAYLAIIGMGKEVIGLLLEQAALRDDDWFEALKAVAKADPAIHARTHKEGVDAWLEWGRTRGYLG